MKKAKDLIPGDWVNPPRRRWIYRIIFVKLLSADDLVSKKERGKVLVVLSGSEFLLLHPDAEMRFKSDEEIMADLPF